jgi:hypothetical protein
MNQQLLQAAPSDKGKLANDHNKAGEQAPTQTNQARRTPHSRSDREDHIGGSNQAETRRTGAGVPKKP